MPGLLRGVARTAVIAGTATHVSNNVSRRQANRWAQQEQPQQQYAQSGYSEPAVQPAQESVDPYEQLKQIGELKAQGILTEAEFQAQKARILAG